MTTDPRIAALAEALSLHGVYVVDGEAQCKCGEPFPGDWHEGEVIAAVWPHIAAAILAALPPDWCGHSDILDANNADIRDRDEALAMVRKELARLRDQAGALANEVVERGREIATLRAAADGIPLLLEDITERDAEIARLRRIEEAARAVCADAEARIYLGEVSVPAAEILALRAALEAER